MGGYKLGKMVLRCLEQKMELDQEKIAEAVKVCLERDACYWYSGVCGLSSGKVEHACPNLDREVVLKKEFYTSPKGRVSEECFRCKYTRRSDVS